MSTFEQKQIERYLPELTKLRHNGRLELIARLAISLKQREPAGETPSVNSVMPGNPMNQRKIEGNDLQFTNFQQQP